MPARYQRSASGQWHCPPGEEYARQFGLYYRLRSSAEINWALQRNLRFLEDYLRTGDQHRSISEQAKQSVRAPVAAAPGMTLNELFSRAEVTKDEIFLLIVTREVYVDLSATSLVDADSIYLFPDRETAIAYSQITEFHPRSPVDRVSSFDFAEGTELPWDGRRWRVINLGQSQVSLLNEQSDCRELPRRVFDELVRRGNLQPMIPAAPHLDRERAIKYPPVAINAPPLCFQRR